jgi:hypothetical protein
MLFKNPVRTSKRTPHFTITKINWLTLFKFNPSYGNLTKIVVNKEVLVPRLVPFLGHNIAPVVGWLFPPPYLLDKFPHL